MKKINSYIGIFIWMLMMAIVLIPYNNVKAAEVTTVSGDLENSTLTVSGTTTTSVAAVIIQVYDSSDTQLLAMESAGASNGKYELTFDDRSFSADSYIVKVADYNGGDYSMATVNKKSPAEEYTITFDANGGSTTTQKAITTSRKLTTLPTATRENYEFAGWYTDKTDGDKISISTEFSTDLTVYAHWIKKDNANVKTTTTTDTGNILNKSIKTGDDSHMGLWCLLMMLGAIGMVVVMKIQRKRVKNSI